MPVVCLNLSRHLDNHGLVFAGRVTQAQFDIFVEDEGVAAQLKETNQEFGPLSELRYKADGTGRPMREANEGEKDITIITICRYRRLK